MDLNEKIRRPYTFDRVVRIVFTVLVIAGIVWLINYLRSVLLPFFVACLIAYLVHPVVTYNQKLLHIRNHTAAVLLSLAEMVCIVALMFAFFLPYVIDEISNMAQLFARYAKEHGTVEYMPQAVHDLILKYVDFNSFKELFTADYVMSLIENTAEGMWSLMNSSISVILSICSWAVVLLYLVFILIDYEKFMNGLRSAVPRKYKRVVFTVFDDMQNSMNHYFRGQSLIAFIVGIMFSIGFSIIGLPMAVLFGLFVGLLNMVPYLQLISIPLAVVLSLVQAVNTGQNFWVLFAMVIAVYCIVQLIQDLYLTPRIMGKYMGLNPALIFLSLSVWGALLGFIGLIIALPLTTLLLSYYDRYIIHAGE